MTLKVPLASFSPFIIMTAVLLAGRLTLMLCIPQQAVILDFTVLIVRYGPVLHNIYWGYQKYEHLFTSNKTTNL